MALLTRPTRNLLNFGLIKMTHNFGANLIWNAYDERVKMQLI